MLRSLHMLLIVQIFVGSSGVLLNRHYCMGRLMDTALFAEARSCFDYLQEEPPTLPPVNGSLERPDCCDDRHEYLQEVSDAASAPAAYVTAPLLCPLPPPHLRPVSPVAVATSPVVGRAPPPLPGRRLLAWRQVFLI